MTTTLNAQQKSLISSINKELKIHEDSDRVEKAKRDGNQFGLSTGLCITHFCNEMFMQNYDAKLTDERLREILLEEFPKRSVIQATSAYRGYFNGNKHGFGVGDELSADQKLPCYRDKKVKEEKAKEEGKADAKAKSAKKTPAKKDEAPSKLAKKAPPKPAKK